MEIQSPARSIRTSYPVRAERPSLSGASQESVTCPFPASACRFRGAGGAGAGGGGGVVDTVTRITLFEQLFVVSSSPAPAL